MKDQTFLAKNFQEIFDLENRKGNDIEQKFKGSFSESITLRQEIRTVNQNIHREKDQLKKDLLREQRKELKATRDEKILDSLETISANINKSNFKINLILGGIYGKQSYCLENTLENYFLSKQIQKNILKSYKIRQSSRYEILSQLINLLKDGFPKIIIRTDIESFYERIPQKNITTKIKEDNLLSLKTQKFINEILKGYNSITLQTTEYKGVPRGVGISAYLAELFMRAVDNKIKEIPDLIFYARYVDDIIAVFTPQKQERGLPDKYKNEIKAIIEENGLTLNEEKTGKYNLFHNLESIEIGKPKSKPIEFLGYKIGSICETIEKDGKPINCYNLSIEMSDHKLDKYKSKIKLAYDDFKKKKNHDRKRAFKILLARLDYLTSNTRLKNNKSKVFVGIYYSTPFLLNCKSLEDLNRSSQWRINRFGFTNEEKEKLRKCNFEEGFNKKTFKPIRLVNKTYKNHNGQHIFPTNKGILQFGLSGLTKLWKL